MCRFVIADTHFGHENIIRYCNRPFESAEQMDMALISNWNNIVRKDDLVWVLGDFVLESKDYTKFIIKSLNGRKKLVLGNHDRYKQAFYMECGFEFVSPYPVLIDNFIILSHSPLEFLNENCPFFNIYGHVHNDSRYADLTKSGACVSIERTEYKPIELDELKNRWRLQYE